MEHGRHEQTPAAAVHSPWLGQPRGEDAAAAGWARGEDRSNFQQVAGWGANHFAFMKATEGTTFRDWTFAGNWARAKAEGKPRAAYHFFHPAMSPVDQAHFFVSFVREHGLEHGDMLYADVEISVGMEGGAPVWEFSPEARRRSHQPDVLGMAPSPPHVGVVNSSARVFLDTVASLAGPAHHPILLYTDLSIGRTLTSCAGYELFIAYYAAAPPPTVWPWPRWRFWQPQAGGGSGGGDLDYYHGSAQALHDWAAQFRDKPNPPPPPPPPPPPYHSGAEMFFSLPPGAGQAKSFTLGDQATHLRLSASKPAEVDVYFHGEDPVAVALAGGDAPQEVATHGRVAGHVVRLDGDGESEVAVREIP